MSARQPFIPQSRPPSRSTLDPDPANPDAFLPNGLLPATTQNNIEDDTHPQQAKSTSAGPTVSAGNRENTNGTFNKPLNISSLTKKRAHIPARKSLEDSDNNSAEPAASRPFKPHRPQHTMRIAAPSPFFPSTASFAPMTAFRTPRVPSPTKRNSASVVDDLNVNQAHATTSGPLIPLSSDMDREHTESSALSRAPMPARPYSAASKHQEPEERSNDTFHDHAGSRDPFDFDEIDSDYSRSYDLSYDSVTAVDEQEACNSHTSLRRVKKRIQRDDLDLDLEYSVAKRYKAMSPEVRALVYSKACHAK